VSEYHLPVLAGTQAAGRRGRDSEKSRDLVETLTVVKGVIVDDAMSMQVVEKDEVGSVYSTTYTVQPRSVGRVLLKIRRRV
jgi:hypothetical protein